MKILSHIAESLARRPLRYPMLTALAGFTVCMTLLLAGCGGSDTPWPPKAANAGEVSGSEINAHVPVGPQGHAPLRGGAT